MSKKEVHITRWSSLPLLNLIMSTLLYVFDHCFPLVCEFKVKIAEEEENSEFVGCIYDGTIRIRLAELRL